MMIPIGEQDHCCCGNAILNIILVVITFGCLGMAASDPATGVMLFVIFYIVQLSESTCCSSTYRYLKNIIALRNTGVEINKLKATRPHISFTIQNYHCETRVEHYKDA